MLITGGAGFVGSHLAEHLLAQGYQVTIIDNLTTGRLQNLKTFDTNDKLRVVIEDIRNAQVLDRLMSESDLVYHMAAVVGVQKVIDEPINTIETNIGGTELVLKTARRYRTPVLLASTSEVYGKGVRFPFSEDDDRLLGPTSRNRWAYATSKAIDEFLALAYHAEADLPVVIVRLFNTVGPRQTGKYGMVVPRFVRWALKNQPIQVYGDGNQQRCFGNVYDVVDAIHKLSEEPRAIGQIFNIGTNEEVTIHQLAKRIRERSGSSSEIQVIPYEEAYKNQGFEDFKRRVPNIEKVMQTIEWAPTTPLDTTIDQMVAYYQEHGDV